MIEIRRAALEDAVGIATVHVVSWREAYRGMVPDDFLDRLSVQRRTVQWVNSLSDQGNTYHRAYVAVVDGQVAGFSNYGYSVEDDSEFQGELFAIYLLKSAQGMGIGGKLICATVDGLREMGVESMLVWVLRDNPTRKFYEHFGGLYLREKSIEIGGRKLMEVAYGWRELSPFQGG
ncbi:MAG: GNAT family N-acetyltransferase [Anaerolineales bacterium]|jgi:GNAT superfamily N-acetyltransferase|nr:GNAT family N-acetyltransferase [Anaerolineales bacterium]